MSRVAGKVSGFDADAGLGTVRRDTDGTEHAFHCTAIADGSRQIDSGVVVTYELVAGHAGKWEATDLRPLEG